ncbi:6864_t:CDS:2 [Entrophospora sp. SA101]|nr:6864_t:CDS:2 [Entrophospora sp. SA101]CAJ0828369.1 4474_t:CDS:2 [Entrophospora sp. SA101]CAJ0895963.1 13755_t:CDS:2 [Entrophospora sp. SA101]
MQSRTILLIGRTGSGKSTVANVISGTKEFKESSGSTSETRDANVREFLIDGMSFRLIDTVGLGDTKLTQQEVLYKLADASHSIENGLSQILFVTSGRFTKEEVDAYGLLRTIIFDNNVVKYTTIVRTNFPEFEDADECENDKRQIINENKDLSAVIKACKKVIHIDNPPLVGRAKETNKIIRDESRKRVLLHLNACKEVYRPENLDQLNERIGSYMTEKEVLEKLVADRKFREEKEQQRRAAEEHKRATEAEIKRLKDEAARQAREHAQKKSGCNIL